MIINLQQFLHLPVHTESGTKLGTVYDLEIDVDSHTILRYLVRPNFLSVKNFLVQRSQIKEIKATEIIVYDSEVQNFLPQAASDLALGE